MYDKILASTWWHPKDSPIGATTDIYIGAVAVMVTADKWKARIGYAYEGGYQSVNELLIAEGGDRLNKSEATGIFPDLPGNEYTNYD